MHPRSYKSILLLGAINGFIFYLVYQPVKIAYVKYLWSIKDDKYVYVALPQIYRIARDAGEVFVWTLLFILASYTVHRLWARNLNSNILLWLRIAIVAMLTPVVALWLFPIFLLMLILVSKAFGICIFPLNCDIPLEMRTSLIIRESVDIKFEILLFVVATLLNLAYGAIFEKISKAFMK